MHDSNGKDVPNRHERIIEISDLLSKNLIKKLGYTRIGAEVPQELAEEHARLTARLSELRYETSPNGATATA